MEEAEILADCRDQMGELICLDDLEAAGLLGGELAEKRCWSSWVVAAPLSIGGFTGSTLHADSVEGGGVSGLIPGVLQDIKGSRLCR